MESRKKKIVLFFAFAVLFPSALSLTHVFAHDGHQVCTHSTTHFHEKSVDCDFCDLQHHSFFTFEPGNYELVQFCLSDETSFDNYSFLSDFQKLPFELRGPPAIGPI